MNYSEIYAEAVTKATALATKLDVLSQHKSYEDLVSMYVSKTILEKLEKDNEIS